MQFTQTITLDNLIANPTAYPNAVVLPAREYASYEEFAITRAIEQGRADIKAGRTHSHEDVFNALSDTIEQVRKQRSEKL